MAEYVPLSVDFTPEGPVGAVDTFLVRVSMSSSCYSGFGPKPEEVPRSRFEVCGISLFNDPGEIHIHDISKGSLYGYRAKLLLSEVDAAVYNVSREGIESVREDGAQRFCRASWGIVSVDRPLSMSVSPQKEGAKLRGHLFVRPVLSQQHRIEGSDQWEQDKEFMRFVELVYDVAPDPATLTLVYQGWLGRSRSGL